MKKEVDEDNDVFEVPSMDLRSPDQKAKDSKPMCPRCGAPLSEKLLKLGNNIKIHRAHQKEDAEKEWEKLKIPKIDWGGLPKRCEKHYPYLEDVTRGKVKSPFKDECFEKHRSAAPKSAKQKIGENFQWCSPGYYGPRGADV